MNIKKIVKIAFAGLGMFVAGQCFGTAATACLVADGTLTEADLRKTAKGLSPVRSRLVEAFSQGFVEGAASKQRELEEAGLSE